MLYFGLITVGSAVFYLISAAVSSIRHKKDEYDAICALLLHIRGALSSGGGTLSEITRGFKSDTLSKNGLLECLGTDIGVLNGNSESYKGKSTFFRDRLSDISFSIDKSDADKLILYLESFGKSYLEEEKRKLTEIFEHFRSKSAAVAEKSEKNIKVIWILFVFCFVAVFIFLL